MELQIELDEGAGGIYGGAKLPLPCATRISTDPEPSILLSIKQRRMALWLRVRINLKNIIRFCFANISGIVAGKDVKYFELEQP